MTKVRSDYGSQTSAKNGTVPWQTQTRKAQLTQRGTRNSGACLKAQQNKIYVSITVARRRQTTGG